MIPSLNLKISEDLDMKTLIYEDENSEDLETKKMEEFWFGEHEGGNAASGEGTEPSLPANPLLGFLAEGWMATLTPRWALRPRMAMAEWIQKKSTYINTTFLLTIRN